MRNFLIALAGVAIAGQAEAANLLTNGSFEQGADGLTGWSLTDTNTDPYYPASGNNGHTAPVVIAYGQAGNYPTGAFGESVPTDNASGNPGYDAVGTHGLYFSSDNGTQTLSQSVTLVAGVDYTFGFDYYLPANGYSNPNNANFSASVGTENFSNFSLGSAPAGQWTLVSGTHTFTASGSGAFNFAFTAGGYPAKDIVVDRVYLAPTAEVAGVPEVATWGMMVVGFGAIGGATRRRRINTTFA